MRDLTTLDKYRIKHDLIPLSFGSKKHSGAFQIQTSGRKFLVIASVDEDKNGMVEHISISHKNEKIMPTWEELFQIKDLFFLPEEECVQIFPKKSEYVNIVQNCFHIWRPCSGVLFGREKDADCEFIQSEPESYCAAGVAEDDPHIRDDGEGCKAVKHMDKAQMEKYLQTIYQCGYQAGVKAMATQMKSKVVAAATTSPVDSEG